MIEGIEHLRCIHVSEVNHGLEYLINVLHLSLSLATVIFCFVFYFGEKESKAKKKKESSTL